MGCSENNNISAGQISRGNQGKRGSSGIKGEKGKDGARGPAGPIGPSGDNKLDINLQEGSKPFVDIKAKISKNSNNWDTLAFCIFAGTDIFTPEYSKIAYSIKSPNGESFLFFRLIFIDSGGRVQTVSEANVSENQTNIHVYKILTAQLKNLPNTETVLILQGAIGEAKDTAVAMKADAGKAKEAFTDVNYGKPSGSTRTEHRAYALEMR